MLAVNLRLSPSGIFGSMKRKEELSSTGIIEEEKLVASGINY
jgi:hypothetical protein